MSSSDIRADSSAYSTRQCRCGAEMRRLVAPSRHAWDCTSCGRQQRR